MALTLLLVVVHPTMFYSSGTHSTCKFKVYDDDDDDDEHENQFCNQELFCKIDSACTE